MLLLSILHILFKLPLRTPFIFFFFFNDTPPTEIYTLSLHDALPISDSREVVVGRRASRVPEAGSLEDRLRERNVRSEEHTSELQSQSNLVCRLLLEKKKNVYYRSQILQNQDCRQS